MYGDWVNLAKQWSGIQKLKIKVTQIEFDLATHRFEVVRAPARGAGGRGSIPDRVTPKT